MVDVSGFSRLMTRDEEWTTREIRAFHARVLGRVHEFEGRVVDTAGDSVFGEFDSVVNATRCAQAIQADQVARNLTQPPDRRIETRIGVHVGDVIVEEYKVYGDGVNIAARLEAWRSRAHPGVGRGVPAGAQQGLRRVRGRRHARAQNIDQPVHVYRLLPSALVPSRRGRPLERGALRRRRAYRPKTRREERLAGARAAALAPEPPAAARSLVER
jgi:adenylate cyclase